MRRNVRLVEHELDALLAHRLSLSLMVSPRAEPIRKETRRGRVGFVPRLEGSMSLELLDARETAEGMAVTFATDRGIERLEGSPDEMARLARAMQQVAALGQLNDEESAWLEE